MRQIGEFGPEGAERAVVLTFDNLGEASALERGEWPPDQPLGSHPTVTEALPRLLDELDGHDLRATFFVEAINCELYPDALGEIVSRGHELGVHGWRHEPWGQLAADQESTLLWKATEAFSALGIEARAFRPPGGELTPRTGGLLRELGYGWCSPAGGAPSVDNELAFVPFEWELVDAYHLMGRFGGLRASRGDSEAPLGASVGADRLTTALAAGGCERVQTVVLHPFLMLDEEWHAGALRVLDVVASLGQEEAAWVGPGGSLASWLLQAAR